jgi:hypothetical protein
MAVHPVDQHEADTIKAAVVYRAHKFLGRGCWARMETISLAEALDLRRRDYMVYAVTKAGRSTFLTDRNLKLAGVPA